MLGHPEKGYKKNHPVMSDFPSKVYFIKLTFKSGYGAFKCVLRLFL